MKKIYCKNCKFNGGWLTNTMVFNGVKGWKWCESEDAKAYLNPDYFKNKKDNFEFTGLKRKRMENVPVYKSELNSTGECRFYKANLFQKIKEKFL